MVQPTISLAFIPTPSGRRSLVITVTGDCTPRQVRECIEADIPVPSGLVFGWVGNDGIRLYELIPHPWPDMVVRIEELLGGKFVDATITRPKELLVTA